MSVIRSSPWLSRESNSSKIALPERRLFVHGLSIRRGLLSEGFAHVISQCIVQMPFDSPSEISGKCGVKLWVADVMSTVPCVFSEPKEACTFSDTMM